MKRKSLVLIALLFVLFSIPFSLSACSKNKTIVEIDNTKLTLDDFLYDIYLLEQEREIWNNNYKEGLGVDYWDYAYEGITMEQLAKDTIMTRVVLYDILSKQAKKDGYTLNDDELAATEANVDKLIASMTAEQLHGTGMDRDILITAFNKLTLGDKYYMAISDDFDINEDAIKSTIDPDEYREYQTECLYIPTAEVSYQNITPYDEDKLDEAYDRIQDIKELTLKGTEFDEVLEQVEGAIHYNRSFILSDNTAEEEYKEAAKALDNGDFSDVVTTNFGHYIIHMLDNNSSVRYEKAIQDAIQAEKTALFKIHYDELLLEYDITINSEYWDTLDLGSITNSVPGTDNMYQQ
ncbi:MAG: hypothetical protein PHC56_04460 [Herbinix sp.]|nr:hypothetical protein [Herbinix sp.]